MIKGTQLLPFSYTRLTDWERCPFYAYNVHVLKKRGPPGAAMARGTLIHEHAQRIVEQEQMPTLRMEVAHYASHFKEARDYVAFYTEEKFAVTKEWQNTTFLDRSAWGRGVWDLVLAGDDALRVIDYKTGKVYDSHVDQLKLYAVTAVARWPKAPKVVAEAWYFDQPIEKKMVIEFDLKDMPKLRKEFTARVEKMASDNKMVAKANVYCRNCHLNRRNGGTCKTGDAG